MLAVQVWVQCLYRFVKLLYASCQLKLYDVRYPTHDLDLATLVFSLNMWKYSLHGERFKLFIDRTSLKYLRTQKDLNMRQQHFMEFFEQYDFDLTYHPGKANVVANALGREERGAY